VVDSTADAESARVIRIDPADVRLTDLDEAAAWIGRGGIVAMPTETFYGLAADPRSSSAVESLLDLKGRPAGAALPLVAASIEQVEDWCGPLPPRARRLARRFWPGPLSIVLAAREPLAAGVLAGGETIAVRVPSHPVTRALVARCGHPLTATSANRSGEPPARSAVDLAALARDPRLYVIDAGETAGGRPSTIVDVREPTPRLVRDGAVPWNRVLESLER
jgi:L-threonylcarbamoyladenylate synthase